MVAHFRGARQCGALPSDAQHEAVAHSHSKPACVTHNVQPCAKKQHDALSCIHCKIIIKQLQCKDEGKFVSTVAGTRKDTLAWQRLKCHMRRRARLAGLQRPRAASCQLMLLLLRRLLRPAAPTDTEGAAGLRCILLVVLTNKMARVCSSISPFQNHGCLADASKSNGALLYTADACFAHTSTDTLCRCVSALRS